MEDVSKIAGLAGKLTEKGESKMKKFSKSIVATLALTAFLGLSVVANADVTGDFKVTGIKFAGDDAIVCGTVNNGAIQSKKTVAVDITYDYSFAAAKITTIPGTTEDIIVIVPGKCVTGIPNTNGCYEKDGVTQKNPLTSENWIGTTTISTITTEPQTITQHFNGASGMTAITEPTIEKGRLNPKGKITGYNWESTQSIVPNASLVDPLLIPAGYDVISVTINSVAYTAYLIDAYGLQIADTVMTGTIN